MADDEAPTAAEYCPGRQSPAHPAVSPATDEKLPAVHAAHVPEAPAAVAVENVPAAQ